MKDMIVPEESLNRAFPWIPGVKAILSAIQMHPFDGTHLLVGSDYSGTHAKSAYLVYTFLLADAERSSYWPTARAAWRRRFLPDGRRLSFKTLNDQVRRRSLEPFLETLRYLFGACISIAVHKKYSHMSSGPLTLESWRKTHTLQGRWRPAAFEQMHRTAHLFALLVGHFSKPGQDVTWITDEDEIAANDTRLTDIMHFAAMLCGVHVPHHLGVFAMNTSAYQAVGRSFEDFIVLPDLVAGTLAEFLNLKCHDPNWNKEGDWPMNCDLFTPKTDLLCSWLNSPQLDGVYRCIIVVDLIQKGKFRVKRLVFKE